MSFQVSGLLARVAAPPIPEVHGWLEGQVFPPDKPLLDLAQAVPSGAPPTEMTDHVARSVAAAATWRYAPIEGLPELRRALADDIGFLYGAPVSTPSVLITAGCNQAFCLATMALAGVGDEIILPAPYYFNHQMWLEMLGVRVVHLPLRPECAAVPSVDDAFARITPRTKAIVLVSPNNPTGAVYPPSVIQRFYELARSCRVALVLDETYRDFLPTDGAPHALFGDPGWADALVHLYSFSKVFCMTGYRVGAIVAAEAFVAQVAKAMDCVAICAPRIGQEAALFGLRHLAEWRRKNADDLRGRLTAMRSALATAPEYELVSAGAYFAYVRHPFDGIDAIRVARRLAVEENLLCLPGSIFGPDQEPYLRLAFANVPTAEMPAVAARLRGLLRQ